MTMARFLMNHQRLLIHQEPRRCRSKDPRLQTRSCRNTSGSGTSVSLPTASSSSTWALRLRSGRLSARSALPLLGPCERLQSRPLHHHEHCCAHTSARTQQSKCLNVLNTLIEDRYLTLDMCALSNVHVDPQQRSCSSEPDQNDRGVRGIQKTQAHAITRTTASISARNRS